MAKIITAADAKKELETKSKKISDEDIELLLDKETEIRGKFKRGGPLKEYFENVKAMLQLVKAYWRGEYRQIPWFTIAAIAAALLYVINPLDLVPDFIPVVGLVDDALVIAACIVLVKEDLARFEAWRNTQLMTDKSDS